MCLYFGVLSETLKLMMLSYIVVEMPLNNTIYIPSSIILLSYLIYFLETSVYFLEFQLTFCLVKPLSAAYIFNDGGATVCGFWRL